MDLKTNRAIARAAEKSALVWATSYLRLPKKAEWSFVDRMWQPALFDDPSTSLVVIKCTQIGITTIMISRILWFLQHNIDRGMYTFPRRDDVNDFVASRLEVMIKDSPAIRKRMKGADNVRMKQIGDSFLHFSEASVPPRMQDVDKLVNDEIDLSNPDVLAQYPSRLDASKWKIHHRLSTPTVPGFGIDALYEKTDRKEWLVKCPACNCWQKLDWEETLRVEEDTGRVWYACVSCDRVLAPWDIDAGQWVAQNYEYNDTSSGYHVSQMMLPRTHPPAVLWEHYKKMPLKHFHNLRLGRPFRPPGGSITRELFLQRALPSETNQRDVFDLEHAPEKSSQYYLSFDQGNDLYVMVGRYKDGAMNIVRAAVYPFEMRGGWERIQELINLFRPRMIVGDAIPNRHSARDLIDSISGNKALLAFYSETATQWNINKKERAIHINRTEMLDRARDTVIAGGVQLAGMCEPMYPQMA